MKMKLKNETVFRNEDIRRLMRKCLIAVGYDMKSTWSLRVTFRHGRSRRVSGEASMGRSRMEHGLDVVMRVPQLELWSADTWRQIVAVTVHECMHLVGTDHKDMTEGQYRCTLPLPAWAKSLTPLRVELEPVEAEPEARRAAVRADRLDHARGMLKKAETRLKRAETIRAKWLRHVQSLDRATKG